MQPRHEHWISGEAAPPKAGRYLDSTNPANGEKLTEVLQDHPAILQARIEHAARRAGDA